MTTSGVEGVVSSPVDIQIENTELAEETRLRRAYNVAKRAVQASVIAVELGPTNEAIRFGTYAAVMTQTQSPVVGAAVLGGTTLLVEGGAALATASVLDSENSNKSIDWIKKKANKLAPNGVKMTPPVEAGAAMIGGSAVVLTLKQIEDPERTIHQNRKHGMFTASWMATFFAAEGALVAEGIDDFHDPKKVGAALIAVGGLAAISRKAKKHFKREASSAEKSATETTLKPITSETYGYSTLEIMENNPISEEEIERAIELNDAHRNLSDEAVKIGLYGEDVRSALENPDSILARFKSADGEKAAYAPVLVPVDSLEWYNHELLKEKYGETTKIYYYASPPVPSNEFEKEKITTKIRELVDQGAVVIYDYYPSQPHLVNGIQEDGFSHEDLGRGAAAGEAAVFADIVRFGEVSRPKTAPSLAEIYEKGVETGDLILDKQNGITHELIVGDEESEKAWEIYEKPFEKLGKDDAMYAGFDKETFMGMLKNPRISKFINRKNGELTTLCLITDDFEQLEWFNGEFYKDHFPEYHNTNNILAIPGIVTGDNIKGASYSMKITNYILQLASKRNTDILVTFECSPISKKYIPMIIRRAINYATRGETDGFKKPVSEMGYKALLKA